MKEKAMYLVVHIHSWHLVIGCNVNLFLHIGVKSSFNRCRFNSHIFHVHHVTNLLTVLSVVNGCLTWARRLISFTEILTGGQRY